MELTRESHEPTFATLYARLIALVNQRIRNGEFSERALAKLLGVSQPQLHNVLKGARRLHTPLADAMLARFHVTPLDLFTDGEVYSKLESLERLDPYGQFAQEADHASATPGERIRYLRRRHSRSTHRGSWEAN